MGCSLVSGMIPLVLSSTFIRLRPHRHFPFVCVFLHFCTAFRLHIEVCGAFSRMLYVLLQYGHFISPMHFPGNCDVRSLSLGMRSPVSSGVVLAQYSYLHAILLFLGCIQLVRCFPRQCVLDRCWFLFLVVPFLILVIVLFCPLLSPCHSFLSDSSAVHGWLFNSCSPFRRRESSSLIASYDPFLLQHLTSLYPLFP